MSAFCITSFLASHIPLLQHVSTHGTLRAVRDVCIKRIVKPRDKFLLLGCFKQICEKWPPLNDFRFSFQLYFAISLASRLGGVSARNSYCRGEVVSVDVAGGITGNVLTCCHLRLSTPQTSEFRPRLVNVGLPADHRFQDCLGGIHYESYNNLRGRTITFSRIITCSRIITFNSAIITLSSVIIIFVVLIITLSSTITTLSSTIIT